MVNYRVEKKPFFATSNFAEWNTFLSSDCPNIFMFLERMPLGIGMSLDVFRSLGRSLYRYRALEICLSLDVFRLHFRLSLDVFRMSTMVVYIYILYIYMESM